MWRIGSPLIAFTVLVCGRLAEIASARIGASDDYFRHVLKLAGGDNVVIGSG
jgi:hypothetical protein